ncbi:MAG: hypothetical protein IJG94_06305 [Clostridia bacterium]|nr:hypothetical protein [Clostridia bacterium]
MKRITGLLLALALVLAMAVGALADGVTFSTKYFTLTLPQGWEIETEVMETEDGMEDLGCVASPEEPGLVIESFLLYDEDAKDKSLWNASEEELKAYAQEVMETYADDKPEYIGTIKAGNIPFVLIRCDDSESEYIYADTLTNGYYIMFMAYSADANKFHPLTADQVEQFKSILATFVPVT